MVAEDQIEAEESPPGYLFCVGVAQGRARVIYIKFRFLIDPVPPEPGAPSDRHIDLDMMPLYFRLLARNYPTEACLAIAQKAPWGHNLADKVVVRQAFIPGMLVRDVDL